MNTIIEIRQGDIIEFDGDAIVSPANTALTGGGGLCGVILDEAGHKLAKTCKKIGFCDFGNAVITSGFKLKAKYIIHTPTPAYGQHDGAESDILKSCYWESLRLAEEKGIKSIAFPMLATGIHQYPKEAATKIAFEALSEYLEDNPNLDIEIVMYAKNYDDYNIMERYLNT